MKLSLEIPIKHWDVIQPLTDFDYALAHEVLRNYNYAMLYREQSNLNREVWLDNSFNELGQSVSVDDIFRAMDIIQPTHVVSYESKEPDENLKRHIEFKELLLKRGIKIKLIGVWHQRKTHIKILENLVDILCFPYDEPRQFDNMDMSKYHFLGFKNLDELRINTPRSIDTGTPITCGWLGIDLEERERRPKNLPKYKTDTELNPIQLNLAIKNINAIKAAGQLGSGKVSYGR